MAVLARLRRVAVLRYGQYDSDGILVFPGNGKRFAGDFDEDVMYMHLFCRIPDEQLREIVESRGLYLDPRVKKVVMCYDDRIEIYTFEKKQ